MTLTLFGAGNIGRSFIAPVFSRGGYMVTFVDINRTAVEEINRRGEYDVVTLHPEGQQTRTRVTSVKAIDADDATAVASEVAVTDLVATAVGAGGFGAVCDLVAAGLRTRATRRPGVPLDVILAENIPDAANVARARIVRTARAGIARAGIARAGDARVGTAQVDLPRLGLVEASIGKMVPIVPADEAARDPLLVYAEPYNTLIVDGLGFAGSVPRIPDLLAVDNIRAYVDRKLYIHNLGHAAVAYLAFDRNPKVSTIADALEVGGVRQDAERAMMQSATGLYAEYPDVFSAGDLEAHVADLLRRFANPALNDTLYRVGRDLRRKLGPGDRIVGAMRLLARHGLQMDAVAAIYGAAIGFRATDADGLPYAEDAELQVKALTAGREWIMRSISGLNPDNAIDRYVWDAILTVD